VFGRQRNKKFCRFLDLNEYLLESLLHLQVQLFHLLRPLDIPSSVFWHSRTTILSEVSSALAKYQLYSSKVKYKLN
jgi:hypothetical protein